jgi:predicted  nucleic acid-binding Zn-ribbon protein
MFYFVKSTKTNKKKDIETENEVEYFYELEDDTNNEIIVFDVESINVKSSGKYELNLNSLMNHDGLVYKYGDGKYSVDLENNLKQLKKR